METWLVTLGQIHTLSHLPQVYYEDKMETIIIEPILGPHVE